MQKNTKEKISEATGCLFIAFIIIVVILMVVNEKTPTEDAPIVEVNKNNSNASIAAARKNNSTPSLDYTILSKHESINNDLGLSIYNADIRIDKKITEEELKSFSLYLKASINSKAKNIRYFFYLPGMMVDNGAWATAVFDPDLTLRIIGQSIEDEKLAKNYVSSSNQNYIGQWVDEGSQSYIIRSIRKIGINRFVLEGYSTRDHSSGVTDTLKRLQKNGMSIYRSIDDAEEEYYLLTSNGDLEVYDNQGYIVTYKKIK